MKITVKRTGGFAGLTETLADADTSQLDTARAQQIEQMVHSAGFFSLPAKLPGSLGADMFNFEITISDGERQHTITFNESNPAAALLHKLVNALTKG